MGPLRLFSRTLVATVALLTAAGTAASGQAAGTTQCDALVGFNGTAREGRFAPVILSVENPGARVAAQIELTVSWGPADGTRAPGLTITRDAVLEAGSTLRFPFVVPVPRNARTLRAVVTSRGVRVGNLETDLRPLLTSSRLVAAVSSDLSFDGLSALSGSAGALRVVYPRVDDLPRSWAGYDGVDAVIVHDTYFQQLRADQVEALDRWVVTGGVLVFTGGAAALQHAPAGFGALMPVQVTGLVQRPGLDAIPTGDGPPRRLPGRVELAASRLVIGRLVSSDDGLPLVVQRKLGRGSVWFLAFDPTAAPINSWSGSLSMWRGILEADRLPAWDSALRPASEDAWVMGVLAASMDAFPSLPAVLLFVAAYALVLLPLLMRRSGHSRNARRRLLLLVLACSLATGAGWFVFNHLLFQPGLQTADVARVLSRSGDGQAEVIEKVAYVGSSTQSVEAALVSTDAVVQAAGYRAQPEAPLKEAHLVLAEKGARIRVSGMSVERLAARLLVAHDVVPFDVSVAVRADEASISATVHNGNTRPLRGCFIQVSGRAYALGDVAEGSSVQRTWSAADGLGSASDGVTSAFGGAWNAAIGGATGHEDGRRAALFKAISEEQGSAGGSARLVGWMDSPVLPLSFLGARPLGGRPGLALVSVAAE